MAYSQQGLIGASVTPGAVAFTDPCSVRFHCRRSVDHSLLQHTVRLARFAIDPGALSAISISKFRFATAARSRSQKAIRIFHHNQPPRDRVPNRCLHPRSIVQQGISITVPRSGFRTGPEGPPIGPPDHNILWSASPGRPGYALCFHEVVEKVGVTVRREVDIMRLYRKSGTGYSDSETSMLSRNSAAKSSAAVS